MATFLCIPSIPFAVFLGNLVRSEGPNWNRKWETFWLSCSPGLELEGPRWGSRMEAWILNFRFDLGVKKNTRVLKQIHILGNPWKNPWINPWINPWMNPWINPWINSRRNPWKKSTGIGCPPWRWWEFKLELALSPRGVHQGGFRADSFNFVRGAIPCLGCAGWRNCNDDFCYNFGANFCYDFSANFCHDFWHSLPRSPLQFRREFLLRFSLITKLYKKIVAETRAEIVAETAASSFRSKKEQTWKPNWSTISGQRNPQRNGKCKVASGLWEARNSSKNCSQSFWWMTLSEPSCYTSTCRGERTWFVSQWSRFVSDRSR